MCLCGFWFSSLIVEKRGGAGSRAAECIVVGLESLFPFRSRCYRQDRATGNVRHPPRLELLTDAPAVDPALPGGPGPGTPMGSFSGDKTAMLKDFMRDRQKPIKIAAEGTETPTEV